MKSVWEAKIGYFHFIEVNNRMESQAAFSIEKNFDWTWLIFKNPFFEILLFSWLSLKTKFWTHQKKVISHMVSHTVWILVRNECLSFETFISFEGHCKADYESFLYQKSSWSRSHMLWKLFKRFVLKIWA